MDSLEVILYTVVILYVFSSVVYGLYRGVYLKITSKNTPILFQYYTKGGRFIPIHTLKKNNLSVFVYSSINVGTRNKMATIYSVYLPFKTNIHLLAIAKRQDMSQFRIDKIDSVMEPVSLEGDYAAYFTLYAEKNTQSDVRYVLDPKAMAFTIDFCKSHSWEIRGSELYFVQENVPNMDGDDTLMWEDIMQFIEEIEPAIIIPLTDTELSLRAPYGSAIRQADRIICPVCSNKLLETSNEVYECPKGHGCLLHGSDLVKLRKKELTLKFTVENTGVENRNKITCPSCGSIMEKVHYAMTTTVIDSCNVCQFRWLDGGELKS